MGARAEFAGFEFAGAEFGIDPKLYADIVSAATVALSAAASVGRAISVSASAQIGATASPGYTAVMSTIGAALANLIGAGRVGDVQGVSPGAALRLAASAASGYAVTAEGTTALTFTATAEPHSGESDASGNWSWSGFATGATLQKFDGTGVFGFMADPQIGMVANTAPVTTCAFAGIGKATAVMSTAGYTSWSFVTVAGMATTAAFAATAGVSLTGSGKATAMRHLYGAPSLAFAANAVGAWRQFKVTTATGSVAATASAAGGALTGGTASAALAFAGTARIANVRWFSANAAWRFTAVGDPGSIVFPQLPASRARFVVPPRGPAFVVPPEPEFEEV